MRSHTICQANLKFSVSSELLQESTANHATLKANDISIENTHGHADLQNDQVRSVSSLKHESPLGSTAHDFNSFPSSPSLSPKLVTIEALGTLQSQYTIPLLNVPTSPHTQCARSNNGATRSNCAHLSHFVQLLEQLKLADSLATTPRPTQRLTQHKFSFYTEPEKEQSSSLRFISANSQDGRSVTAPNLFLVSSKLRFLSKMFLLFYFSVSSLNLRSS